MIRNIVFSLVAVECPYLNSHTYSVLDDWHVVGRSLFSLQCFIYSLYSFRNFKPGKKLPTSLQKEMFDNKGKGSMEKNHREWSKCLVVWNVSLTQAGKQFYYTESMKNNEERIALFVACLIEFLIWITNINAARGSKDWKASVAIRWLFTNHCKCTLIHSNYMSTNI